MLGKNDCKEHFVCDQSHVSMGSILGDVASIWNISVGRLLRHAQLEKAHIEGIIQAPSGMLTHIKTNCLEPMYFAWFAGLQNSSKPQLWF